MKLIVGIVKLQNSVAFSAGHYYGNPTGYGEPDQIGGGKYPKLAADYLITLKKSKLYENPLGKTVAMKGKVIGTEIKAATLKNRFYPPFQEAKFEINYNNGVNKLAGIIDIAKGMGLVEVAGSWVTCPLLDLKVQGEVKFYQAILQIDVKPLLDEIEKTLKTSGYSSSNDILETMITIEEESK